MQIENTRWYRVRDVAGHCAVSVATIDRAIESGQLTAVTFGRGTGAFWVSGAAVLADEQACAQAAGELLRSTMRGRWWWRHEAGGSGGVHGGAAVPALLAGGVSVVGAHCRCCGAHGVGPPGGDGQFECQVDPEGVLSPEERACRGTAATRAYFTALALRSSRARAKAAVVKRAVSVRSSTARGRPGSSREGVRGLAYGRGGRCLGHGPTTMLRRTASAGGVRRCLPAQSFGSGVVRRGGCGGAGVVSAVGQRSQASMSARFLDEVSLRLLLDRAGRRRDAGDANPARPRALPASVRCVAVRRCDGGVRARSLGRRASVARARGAAIPVR
jgi:hypothetical protein